MLSSGTGVYIIRAFLDTDGNGGLGTTEPAVSFGNIVVAEGVAVNLDLPLQDRGVATPNADVYVQKTAPTTASPGDVIVYVLTVGNNGPEAAPAVSLTDTLPGDVALVDISGTACGAVGNAISCNFGTLAAGTAIVIN